MNKSDFQSLIDQAFNIKAKMSEIGHQFTLANESGNKRQAETIYQDLCLQEREFLITKQKIIKLTINL